MDLTILRNFQGLHAPLKLVTELRAVNKVIYSFLQSSAVLCHTPVSEIIVSAFPYSAMGYKHQADQCLHVKEVLILQN